MPRENPNQIIENKEVIFELKPLKKSTKYTTVEYIIIPIVAVFMLLLDRGHLLMLLLGLIESGIQKILNFFM